MLRGFKTKFQKGECAHRRFKGGGYGGRYEGAGGFKQKIIPGETREHVGVQGGKSRATRNG